MLKMRSKTRAVSTLAFMVENLFRDGGRQGSALIACPSLFDYFRRTVVLVIEQTPEGAMGVVLNRESETAVADAVPQLAGFAGADELVHIGGPVAPESVVALGEFGDIGEAGTAVTARL